MLQLLPIDQWQSSRSTAGEPSWAATRSLAPTSFRRDMKRPGMLYGAVLRSPTYRGKLMSVDVEPARAMAGVVVVKDGDFVGVAAPTSYAARQAIEAIAKTAKWEESPLPPSDTLYDYLREHAEGLRENPFADEVKAAAKSLQADLQHRLRAARAARTADGAGRVDRRQAHGLDRHAGTVPREGRVAGCVSTWATMRSA